MTDVELLQTISGQLEQLLSVTQSIYVLLWFVIVVGAGAIITYMILRPLWWFLR